MGFREKIIDWKNRLKDRHMFSIVITCLVITVFAGLFAYKKQTEFKQVMENQYNMAFYELVDYMQNVETLLAKSTITSTPEHGAETLTNVWRESNLALTYLAQLPMSTNELSNTSKFLNQVSDYSYTLSRKNIYNEKLTDEELENLELLYSYSVDLGNTLNQLAMDIDEGKIKWGELYKKGSVAFAQQVSNISFDGFSHLNHNLEEYAGLIYDGAFSEHLTSTEKKGLTGGIISVEEAKKIVEEFVGREKIEETVYNGLIEGDINVYYFSIKTRNNDKNNRVYIEVSQKGGHVVLMNFNRDTEEEIIDEKQAVEIGKKFLNDKGFPNMKETYYMKQNGILTINYAFSESDITVYSDLIKVKIALDNGEVLGIESMGYLNSHTVRKINSPKISKEDAKNNLNSKLEILSEGLAIIPTKWATEILCWEFKGNIDGKEFLIYINAENGREENILVIINTPNGTLTM